MKKFDVLDRNQEILTSHFLEASAGTGKTFAIEHLVIRLLLSGKVTLDQIAVLTFTRSATRELKERIRWNLVKAVSSLKEEKTSWDYLAYILEQGKEEKRHALVLLEEALSCYDSASVFTIHGFCHHLLTEFAFEAKVPFRLASVESKGYQTKLRETVLDFFRTALKEPDYCAEQLMEVLSTCDQNSEKMQTKILSLVEHSAPIQALSTFEEDLISFNRKLDSFPSVESKKFLDDFLVQKESYKEMKSSSFLDQAVHLGKILEKKSAERKEFAKILAQKKYFLELMREHNLKVRAKKIDLSVLHYPELFERVHKDLWPIIERAKNPKNTMLRIAKACREKWCEESTELAPDELLNNMQKALNNPLFLEKIRGRYQIAIIDEFQDTDPVQWNIFEEVFVKGNKMIALVGDPKQSIYGFRNADVYTYLDAAKVLGENKKAFLDRNFRSDPLLVHALNAFFSSSNWISMPKIKHSLVFHPVKAQEDGQNYPFEDQKNPLHFFLAEGEPTREQRWPTYALEDRKIFPYIAQETLNLVEKESFQFSDIGVLIKDRYQAFRLQAFLKKMGIPANIKRNKAIEESKAFLAFKELIYLMKNPSGLNELKQVLLGSFFHFPYESIKGGYENELLLKARAFFHQLKSSLQEKGLGFFFEHFLSSTWQGVSLLQQTIRLNGLEFLFELRQICEYLLERTKGMICSVDQLLIELENQIGAEEENKAMLLEEQKGVSLMTAHTSKGLEFPIVFALGVASRHESKPTELSDLDEEEQEAEKMRILYVALTRAKKRVYVPLVLKKGESFSDTRSLSSLETFLQKAIQDKPLFKEHILLFLENFQKKQLISYEKIDEQEGLLKKTSPLSSVELFAPPSLEHLKPKEFVYSFSSLVRNTGIAAFSAEPTLDDLPIGTHTGIVLHAIFENIFKYRLFHPFNEDKIMDLIEEETLQTDLKEKQGMIFDLVKEIIHFPLIQSDSSFSLADLSPRDVYPEMEFLFSHQNVFFKGFADLVFKKDNRYFILDWKSNWLGSKEKDYSLERIRQCMQDHKYDVQASLYASALERYVKLFDIKPFEEVFGGALYVFLRGKKIYHFYPSLHSQIVSSI